GVGGGGGGSEDGGGGAVGGGRGERGDHATGGVRGAAVGGGTARARGRARRRSTRLPATRSCRPRLSRRSPAMMKPIPSGAAETKYAKYRSRAAPIGSGAPSAPTTRTPINILPIVCPSIVWSTVVYTPAKTSVKTSASTRTTSVASPLSKSRTSSPHKR